MEHLVAKEQDKSLWSWWRAKQRKRRVNTGFIRGTKAQLEINSNVALYDCINKLFAFKVAISV